MKKVYELVVGEKVDFFAIVKECKNGTTSTDKNYISFSFEDVTGTVSGKYWDMSLEQLNNGEGIAPGIIAKVRGKVGEWQNKKQVTIEKIRPVNSSDEIDEEDFFKKAPLSYSYMYNFIVDVVKEYTTGDLKKITLAVLSSRKDKLVYYPASIKVHHNIKTGLLYHTYCMLKVAIALSELYSFNKGLLFAGVIIHDLGKIDEIESNENGIATDYTKEGKLLGHMIEGIKSIHDLSRELNIDSEITLLLEHMIASHHNKPEFGAVKAPMFYEAELLHYIDMIDSRSFMYQNATESAEPGTFTDKVFFLDNKQIYKHTLEEEEA